MKYCGVGAHPQNGTAASSICTVSSMARLMMLYTSLRCPETADDSLWPMAVDYAVLHVYNYMPNPKSGHSPLDIFTGTIMPCYGIKKIFMSGVALVMYWTTLYIMVINSLVGNLNLVVQLLWESLLSIVAMSP